VTPPLRITKRVSRALAAGVLSALAAALLVSAISARGRQPNAEYAARRQRLLAKLDAPVVLFGYTGKENTLEFLRFQQEEDFYYLTGHNEENAALVLVPSSGSAPAREILFLPPKNPRAENWNGSRLSAADSGIEQTTGFREVKPFSDLSTVVAQLAKASPRLYTELPDPGDIGYPHKQVWSDWLRKEVPGVQLEDVTPKIHSLREIKSAGEIALLTRAAEVSVDAQLEAMHVMRPGLFEYQVAARMEFVHTNEGCTEEAYAPIVGAGFNSTVLHYDLLESRIADGDIVVLDVACAQDGYAADITRTLPANGRFSPRQREIYEIVLGAQNAAIAAAKPGMLRGGRSGNSLFKIAFDYIDSHGKDKAGNSLGKYLIHGISHHLGLNVHDPGDAARPLEPGMVITIEPGIYLPDEKLGARIEDDVLITETGAQVLTARLPRNPDEVEAVMAQGRAARDKNP